MRQNNRLKTAISPIVKTGWGGRDRTSVWRNQNPLPYRLATPQTLPPIVEPPGPRNILRREFLQCSGLAQVNHDALNRRVKEEFSKLTNRLGEGIHGG